MSVMRKDFRWSVLGMLLCCGGCAMTPPAETHPFAATWPGSVPLSEQAPTVSVQPVLMVAPGTLPTPTASEGIPTAAALSALLVKYLHVNGVNAILESPESTTARYTLQCTVPQLGLTLRRGYPEQRLYEAQLDCTLRDEELAVVVWKRSFSQRYEDFALLNLMTKLPDTPHKDDRVLFRECIVPVWDVMASSVRTVLASQPEGPTMTPAGRVTLE
jgi:hypothetical protein